MCIIKGEMEIREEKGCEVSKRNSVFKDISALDYDYLPPESPVRKKELQKLLKMFEPVLTLYTPQFAVINGPVGSGKTELIKRFSKTFQKQASDKGVNVHFEFINCRHGYTNSAVVMKILNRFQPNFRDIGHSTNMMLRLLSRDLEKQNVHMIVVLDEADILIEKCSSKLIYQLSTFSEKGSLSLTLISQKNVEDMLDPSLLNTFNQKNIIHLNKFIREEILAVLNQRVKLTFHQDAIEIGVAELISDIASEWSDVRYAIELLEKAGMLADENNDQKVTVEHVRMAKAETYSIITESKLKALDLHEKLILIAIARCLKVKAFTTIDEIQKGYGEVCREFGEGQLVHSKFLEGINELGMCSVIGIRDTKCEALCSTTISIHDITVEMLERKIVELI